MARELVSEKQLLEWLNAELAKHDQCEDWRFDSVTPLAGEDETGCNWSNDAHLWPCGANSDICLSVAARIVGQARGKFNLK